MKYQLSKRSLKRLLGINPLLLAIIIGAIENSPYDFGIPEHGGLRTPSEQRALYKKGWSQRDGYIKKSYHQSGYAIDIYPYINGKANYDYDILEKIANHIILFAKTKYNVDVIWGGDWNKNGIRVDKDPKENFFDGAHFQISKKY